MDELMVNIPREGTIGNKSLKDKLPGWSDDLYWAIRNRLIERGRLETGRGKGGSVRRVQGIVHAVETESLDMSGISPVSNYPRELDLYEPVAIALREQWAKAQGFDAYLVEITAAQGSRATGGKWTRPDVTAIGHKTYPYVPGRYLEVITFEVKPFVAIDVSAVYEALAHRRAATRAYVIAHAPENCRSGVLDAVDALLDEAKKFGVGVILVDNPACFDSWELVLEAERFEPDPSRLNEFIAQQTSEEMKEQIVRWFK
ncbi:MAG: hypothetical protein AB1648_07835 [Pseudomonadota bacterium]